MSRNEEDRLLLTKRIKAQQDYIDWLEEMAGSEPPDWTGEFLKKGDQLRAAMDSTRKIETQDALQGIPDLRY